MHNQLEYDVWLLKLIVKGFHGDLARRLKVQGRGTYNFACGPSDGDTTPTTTVMSSGFPPSNRNPLHERI
jgi:hypothetical protein